MAEQEGSPILDAVPSGAAEGEVITQNGYGAVRTLAEQAVSKKSIARRLGLDVKTVRKWSRRSWAPGKRQPRGRVLDRWREFLEARAREVGFNAVVLARELEAKGYAGSYSAVAKYVSRTARVGWKRSSSSSSSPSCSSSTRSVTCRSTDSEPTCSSNSSRRYERGAILITSNQSLTVWGEVFGDRVIATAILDRLLHHSTIVNIKGESYRLKEKRKAGLLTRSEPFTDPVPRSDGSKNTPTPEPGPGADR